MRLSLAVCASVKTRSRGFSLIWVLVVLAGITAAALVLSPTVTNTRARELSVSEDEKLAKIADGLRRYVVRNHVIPGTATWAQAAADSLGSDSNSVVQVFPQFARDVRSQRLYIIDPRFTPSLTAQVLPFTQPATGLDPSVLSEVPSIYARALLISSTRKAARLPLANGLSSPTIFDSFWDWTPTPGGSVPFPGLGLTWAGGVSELHIAQIDYRSLFHLISLRKLTYSVEDGPFTMVTNTISRYFLQGTKLKLYALTNGMHAATHVVERDASFDLGSVFEPILWFPFVDGVVCSGVTNYGKLSPALNASLVNGLGEATSTLIAPTFPGYLAGNLSLVLDGIDDFIDTGATPLNHLSQFSLTCWIKPADLHSGGTQAICGQNGLVALGVLGASQELVVTTLAGGSFTVAYPYSEDTWHHVALTGDGLQLRLYLDGALVQTSGSPPAGGTYGASAAPFRAGGGGIFDASGNSFHGELDDLGIFTKALDASQIANLVLNQLPQ